MTIAEQASYTEPPRTITDVGEDIKWIEFALNVEQNKASLGEPNESEEMSARLARTFSDGVTRLSRMSSIAVRRELAFSDSYWDE